MTVGERLVESMTSRHPVLFVALLALAAFLFAVLLLYQTAPRVLYEYF